MSASNDHDPLATEPARIERQIEEARHQLTDTLSALEHKLSARQLTSGVVEGLRDAVMGTGDGASDMLDIVRRNPLPAALIAIGAAWIVLGPSGRKRPAGTASAPETAPHEGADPAPAGRLDRLQDRAGTLMQDNPLVVGALGVALGALVGAVLPMTRRESAWLGETQAQLVEQAHELGRDALSRAREVAKHAGRAAVDVVERELGVTTKPRPGAADKANGSRVH